mmetsp:Transcript_74232/g.221503  ORF Transcript_74232/g.221503 Transcript_74232/m.221503 type:complete len:220 (+) Transcript_74232:1961-2620(+)
MNARFNRMEGRRRCISCTMPWIWFFTAVRCGPMDPVQSTRKHAFKRSACSYTSIIRAICRWRRWSNGETSTSPSTGGVAASSEAASTCTACRDAGGSVWKWSAMALSPLRTRRPHCTHSTSAQAQRAQWSRKLPRRPCQSQPSGLHGQQTRRRSSIAWMGRCGGEVRAKGWRSSGQTGLRTQDRQNMCPPSHPRTMGSSGQLRQTLHFRSSSTRSSGGT